LLGLPGGRCAEKPLQCVFALYEIPSGNDKFEMEVSPPFGEEKIVVYAGTSQLGDLNLKAEGGVYRIKTRADSIGDMTRGVKLIEKAVGKGAAASEFYEDALSVKTKK